MGPPVSPYLPPSNWLQTGYVRHILTVGSAPLVFWGNVVGARYNVRTSISLSKVGMRVEHLVFAPNRCKNQVLAPNTGFSWESRLPTRPKPRNIRLTKMKHPVKKTSSESAICRTERVWFPNILICFPRIPFFWGYGWIWFYREWIGICIYIYIRR